MILAPSAAMPSVVTRGARLDPATADWRNAIIANGGSVDAPTLAVFDTFVRGCKADDIWDKILDCAFFVGLPNLNSILVKMKTPTGVARVLTNNNFVGGDYVVSGSGAGLKGNGTNKWLGTNNPFGSVADASFGAYMIERASATARILGSTGTNTQNALLFDAVTALGCDLPAHNLNTGGAACRINFTSSINGFAIGSALSLSERFLYFNGASAGSNTVTTVAATNPNHMEVFRVVIAPTNSRLSFYFKGSGLTAAQALALSNRVNAVMTAFGANVY